MFSATEMGEGGATTQGTRAKYEAQELQGENANGCRGGYALRMVGGSKQDALGHSPEFEGANASTIHVPAALSGSTLVADKLWEQQIMGNVEFQIILTAV